RLPCRAKEVAMTGRSRSRSAADREPEAAPTTPLGFEERLTQLEAYLAELERGDVPLEEAIRKYEAAVAELRQCYALVEAAEAKIEALLESANGEPRTAVLPLDEDSDEGNGRR